MKQQIQHIIEHALQRLGVGDVTVGVEVPEQAAHGDFATNVAMVTFGGDKRQETRDKWKNPLEVAQAIKEAIIQDQTTSGAGNIERVEVMPPGFINVFVTEASLINQVQTVLKQREGYGGVRSDERNQAQSTKFKAQQGVKKAGKTGGKKERVIGQKGGQKSTETPHDFSRAKSAKRIMVEFADPNPFKEFHIGHLRNISLGESYCRLLEAVGHDVRRVNYQGDVGMHVAKSLWGLWQNAKLKDQISKTSIPQEKAKLLGQAYALGATKFEEDEKAKSEMIELNKKIYVQDTTVLGLWKEGREWSLEYFDTIYDRLGTKFERFYFESEVAPLGMKIVREHVADGVFEESDGAIIFRGETVGLHTRVFVSKEGYATYEAKDLALAPLKYSEWPYDLSIIMTGNEQSEYFKVMLAALAKINPELAAKTRHMPFGMVNLKEGKMSSRSGNVITAEGLIDQAKDKIKEIVQQSIKTYTREHQELIAEKAAIAAVKYAMLRVTAISDIAFDLEASVSFDGESGPYLQYTYARARSVLRKAKDSLSDLSTLSNLSLNSEERTVSRLIAQFPDIVAASATNFAPSTLCTYLFQLAQAFNLFYAKHAILGESRRLALTDATAQVIANGLYLLGIEILEEM